MTLPDILLSHLQGRLSQWLHAYKPLLPHKWLDDLPASLRSGHSHRVRLILDDQTSFLHQRFLDKGLSSGVKDGSICKLDSPLLSHKRLSDFPISLQAGHSNNVQRFIDAQTCLK